MYDAYQVYILHLRYGTSFNIPWNFFVTSLVSFYKFGGAEGEQPQSTETKHNTSDTSWGCKGDHRSLCFVTPWRRGCSSCTTIDLKKCRKKIFITKSFTVRYIYQMCFSLSLRSSLTIQQCLFHNHKFFK